MDGPDYGVCCDHAIAITGFDQTQNPPFWNIRNSWGTGWGENGYGKIRTGYAPGVAGINMYVAFPEVYGG
jgi:C1A family cysteine protease